MFAMLHDILKGLNHDQQNPLINANLYAHFRNLEFESMDQFSNGFIFYNAMIIN